MQHKKKPKTTTKNKNNVVIKVEGIPKLFPLSSLPRPPAA